MKIAVTGATGFIGRYIVRKLVSQGQDCRCWYRSENRCFDVPNSKASIEWIPGELGSTPACEELLKGCDAVVHSGLHRSGNTFRGGEGDIEEFVKKNVLGSIQLIEAARAAKVAKFVYISTCAVHEKILDDRPLDEAHPLWMTTHYGAHKAAVEQFVHSYGFGAGFPIVALRPTGVYGLHHEPDHSKWYDLVKDVAAGKDVDCEKGGKEVHAADVAEATDILLHSHGNAGEVYSCYDRYVSQYEVAQIAKSITNSQSTLRGNQTSPKNEIVSDKIRGLGMQFGGEERLKQTVQEMVHTIK